jgi:hypothetical protein
MKFNIFEGSRRITKLIQLCFVTGGLLTAFNSTPYITLKYLKTTPNDPPILLGVKCSGNDQIKYIDYKLSDGSDAHIELCFAAHNFPAGQLIPYKVEKLDGVDMEWGDKPYSQNVEQYIDRAVGNFILDKAGVDAARNEWWNKKWDLIKEGAEIAIFGCLGIGVLALIIGWIARGFLGIPRGQDKSSNNNGESENITALKDFVFKAENGDTLSQLYLGNYYYNGLHTPPNLKKASKWLSLVLESGDAEQAKMAQEILTEIEKNRGHNIS